MSGDPKKMTEKMTSSTSLKRPPMVRVMAEVCEISR